MHVLSWKVRSLPHSECHPHSHSQFGIILPFQIVFNNDALSGTIPVEVSADPTVYNCNNTQKNKYFCELVCVCSCSCVVNQ